MIQRARDVLILEIDEPTILVIEDDVVLAEMLSILLADDGYRIVTAHTAADALALVRAERPALITLDLTLPDADGLLLLKALRADAELHPVPIVIVSGRSYRPVWGDQVVAVLPKPFDATALDVVVRRTLGSRVEIGRARQAV